MMYSPKYFYENMPDWKKKKDPLLTRIFYRPLSFVVASFCAKLKIKANTISYFSAIIAIVGCVFFLFNNFIFSIIVIRNNHMENLLMELVVIYWLL